MKYVCLALICMLCAGCTRFENPIVAEGGPALDPALLGRWTATREGTQLEFEISRNGAEGRIIGKGTEPGKAPETGEFRLITAHIDRQSFGSVRDPRDASDGWHLFRYELSAGRLTIYSDNDRFWIDAIGNEQVSGSVEGRQLRIATVTASGEELRAIVQGYGTVIFNEEPLVELTRE